MLKFNEGIDRRALLQHLAAMCVKFINRIIEVAYCPISRVCPSRHNDTTDELDAVPCRLDIELPRMNFLMELRFQFPNQFPPEFQYILLRLGGHEHIINKSYIHHSARIAERYCPFVDEGQYEIGKVLRRDIPDGQSNMFQRIQKTLPRFKLAPEILVPTKVAIILRAVHHHHLDKPDEHLYIRLRMRLYNLLLISVHKSFKETPRDILVYSHEERPYINGGDKAVFGIVVRHYSRIPCGSFRSGHRAEAHPAIIRHIAKPMMPFFEERIQPDTNPVLHNPVAESGCEYLPNLRICDIETDAGTRTIITKYFNLCCKNDQIKCGIEPVHRTVHT